MTMTGTIHSSRGIFQAIHQHTFRCGAIYTQKSTIEYTSIGSVALQCLRVRFCQAWWKTEKRIVVRGARVQK
jgi:hypothetical protein